MCWPSIAERALLKWVCLKRYEMNFIPFPPSSFAQRFLAGLLCSSYVSHHYRANPSMTMFNFLWGIWSAVGRICNPVAHLSSINDSAHIPPSLSFVWKRETHLTWVVRFGNLEMLWYNLLLQTFLWCDGGTRKIFSQQLLQVQRHFDKLHICIVIERKYILCSEIIEWLTFAHPNHTYRENLLCCAFLTPHILADIISSGQKYFMLEA